MNAQEFIKPTSKEITAIKAGWPPQIFVREFPLFYAGQVPNMAFLLTSGTIIIKNDSTGKEESLDPPCLIGLHQLLTSAPTTSTATIQANSEASLIDKVTFLDLVNSDSEAGRELKKFA